MFIDVLFFCHPASDLRHIPGVVPASILGSWHEKTETERERKKQWNCPPSGALAQTSWCPDVTAELTAGIQTNVVPNQSWKWRIYGRVSRRRVCTRAGEHQRNITTTHHVSTALTDSHMVLVPVRRRIFVCSCLPTTRSTLVDKSIKE